MRTRQPLRRALVSAATLDRLRDELAAEVAAELNIESIDSFTSAGDLVDNFAKANFRNLGKRFGSRTPVVAKAIEAADASRLAAELASSGVATVDVDGANFPGWQLVQVELPEPDANFPAGHWLQVVLPGVAANEPAEQGKHAVGFPPPPNEPGAQGRQLACPTCG